MVSAMSLASVSSRHQCQPTNCRRLVPTETPRSETTAVVCPYPLLRHFNAYNMQQQQQNGWSWMTTSHERNGSSSDHRVEYKLCSMMYSIYTVQTVPSRLNSRLNRNGSLQPDEVRLKFHRSRTLANTVISYRNLRTNNLVRWFSRLEH